MATTVELKAPKTINDLRFKHLSAYTDKKFIERGELEEPGTVVSFCSKLLGTSQAMLWRCDFNELKKIYRHSCAIFNGFSIDQKPKKEITINGIEYELVNTDRPSLAWVMDVDSSDFEKDPVRMACISYIPKGTTYGDIDEAENLLYPISSRYADFKEHFPLSDYFILSAFFLRKLEKSARLYMVKERWSEKTVKLLSLLKRPSTNG